MLFNLKTKIIAFLTVIGAAILAVLAYRSGKDKAEGDADKKTIQDMAAAGEKSNHDAEVSAQTHNEAVEQANAARKEEDEKEKSDIAAVRDASSIGLRNGSDAINAAIDRTNGGV